MVAKSNSQWKKLQDEESRQVERAFKSHGFRKVDAYSYSEATIRVRVISRKFAALDDSQRLQVANKIIHELPDELQCKIIFVALFTPSEVRDAEMNERFEHPEPIDLSWLPPR